MAYSYKIYPEYNLCYVTAIGIVTGREIFNGTKEIISDPFWKWGINQVNDYRKISRLLIEKEDIIEILEL